MENKFRRKIYQELKEWKDNNSSIKRTGLIIKGSRQIGKTTIVKEFASNEYENVVYINFMVDRKLRQCFDGNLDPDTIIGLLSGYNNSYKFIPNKTVIIFDEIQECASARSSIKPFCLDGRFDIIATGSLLGVSGYNKYHDASIPVGFETHIHMYPMDFKEFLWAKGYDDDFINDLKQRVISKITIPNFIHEKLFELYKWYMFVGGMPDAVLAYLKTNNINDVRNVQRQILDSYKDDFGKHLNNDEKVIINNKDKAKLNLLYESIPKQLARSNNLEESKVSLKFKFSEVDKDAKFREYADIIQWLSDSGLINVCHNLTTAQSPISAYKINNYFKIFMNDTGLFLASLDAQATKALWSNDMQSYKGYIYENLISEQLAKNNLKLYYFEKKSFEIDFIISNNEAIYGLEVKARDGRTKSLNLFIENNNGSIKGIKLAHKNIGYVNNILTIPYYLSFLIDEDFNFETIK